MEQKKIKFEYTVCAIIFGADTSLLQVKLSDGFTFERKSLNPNIDHLDTVFDVTAMGLRRDYEAARIDTDTLDVICAFKRENIELSLPEADDYFNSENDTSLQCLDNQIRAIRLLVECPLRVKRISFKLDSEKYMHGQTQMSNSYIEIFPVNESMGTHEISRFEPTSLEIQMLNDKLPLISFPFSDFPLNTAHNLYDLSYHQDIHVSITLLVTALEIIFLNSEKTKKQILSRRCAIYLFSEKEDILSCCDRIRAMYKKRSDFVHDGKITGIDNADILFLRDCVRKSLIKRMEDNTEKKKMIAQLRAQVESFQWTDERQ